MRTELLSFLLIAIFLAYSALAVSIAPVSNARGPTINIIENALPTAKQTHEVVSIPGKNTLLVSQMSNSVLVKAHVNKVGRVTALAAFQIGSPTSQLHGLALSKRYPGKVWLTLQADNLLLLIDPRAHLLRSKPKVLKVIKVPKGKGPHYVGEYGDDLWVSLQDSSAVLRINYIDPTDYDHYQGLPRPIFVAQHPINKNFYSGEDNSNKIFKIEPATKKTFQIDIPATVGGTTPVGMISGPKGVWFALLGSATEGTGTVGFIGANDEIVPFKLKSSLGHNASILHLVFDLNAKRNKTLWLLSSSIVDSKALDMIIKVTFNDDWTSIVNEQVTVLPTQQNQAHRIIQTAEDQIYATELATSELVSFHTIK